MKNQLRTLQHLQNCLVKLQTLRSETADGTTALLEERAHTQSLIDEELRKQIMNLWEGMAAHTPEQIQMMKEQKNTVMRHTSEIRILQEQVQQMRENIDAIHRLMSKSSPFNCESSLRAQITNEFDI